MKYLKTYLYVVLALVGLSLAVLGIKAALFPAKVAHTAMNSAGAIVGKTLNADNVLHNYEWFYDTNAAFDTRVSQIKVHSGLVGAETDPAERARLNMELAAMRQTCRELAVKYNANSEKLNRKLFKSNNLPETIDTNNCEV